MTRVCVAALLFAALVLGACAQGQATVAPPEIRYGEDVCADCNMIISDPRFAASYAYEVGPGRYQNALFDDIGDMLAFAAKHPEHKVVAWYVHDYESKEWSDAATASYVVSGQVETPMASGIVAFASRPRADAMAYSLGVQVMDWSALQEKFKAGEVGVGMAGATMPMPGGGEPAAQEATLAGPDGSQVTLSVVQPPAMARVGKQPFEVVVSQQTGASAPARVDDLTLEITPEMPTMGHGSPGNVNPTAQGDGRYLGAVNFTMSGPWTVTVRVKRGDETLGQAVFEYAVR